MSDYSTVIHLKGSMMAHLRATTEDGGRVFIDINDGQVGGTLSLILDLAQAKEISTQLLKLVRLADHDVQLELTRAARAARAASRPRSRGQGTKHKPARKT